MFAASTYPERIGVPTRLADLGGVASPVMRLPEPRMAAIDAPPMDLDHVHDGAGHRAALRYGAEQW
jgi:hypothetical protein